MDVPGSFLKLSVFFRPRKPKKKRNPPNDDLQKGITFSIWGPVHFESKNGGVDDYVFKRMMSDVCAALRFFYGVYNFCAFPEKDKYQ